MRGKAVERWRLLCEQAAEEQDANKLMALVEEINQLLDEKTKRLQGQEPNVPEAANPSLDSAS